MMNAESAIPPFEARALLSCYQAAPLLEARKRGLSSARCSFDLGRSELDVTLDERGVTTPVLTLGWESIERIAAADNVCFAVDGAEPTPLRIYSEAAARSFQLWPTASSPALLISGFLMHRVRDLAPHEGASRMVQALGRVQGRWLDTTTGLGYAAIAAAKIAAEVVTIEVEPVVQELARANPWSRELFENAKIRRCAGDSGKLVPALPPESFAAVLHDPPAINLAGELYSAEFYEAVYRVLARRGKFFHYIGDAHSASGARTTRGVMKRLREVGFTRVSMVEGAFGVLAST